MEVDVSKGISICGFRYDVDVSEVARRDCLANQRYGSCSFVEQKIRLDRQHTPERISQTFLHEVIEAINEHLALHVDHDNISRMAEVLHQVMESLDVRFVHNGVV